MYWNWRSSPFKAIRKPHHWLNKLNGSTQKAMKRTTSKVILSRLPQLTGMQMLLVCKSVGNPDRGQYAPLSDPEYFIVDNFEQASAACRCYIEMWDLGGGNWTGGQLYSGFGILIAEVSYNGRIWKDGDRVNRVEIKYDQSGEAYLAFVAHYKALYDKMLADYMANHQPQL